MSVHRVFRVQGATAGRIAFLQAFRDSPELREWMEGVLAEPPYVPRGVSPPRLASG
jgi:hypothetical protein